jgi:hypothetical protein
MHTLRRVPRLLLGLVLVAGFALRVWNNDYGLPYVWSIDEGSHFTSRAVEMLRGDLDPGYYQNPAAYTYLVYVLLRVLYGPLGFLFDLPFGNVTDQFAKDPTEIWVAARTLAAVLCMAGVALAYWAARRIWGTREALVTAAVLAFAFLPVAYSRVAVTDVGSLAGMALALLGAVRVRERGELRDYALAGAAAGLAAGFKYTAGLALLPLGIAAVGRVRADRLRALAGLGAAAALAALVFVALNPYLLGSFGDWWADLRDQAEVAADQSKPGQEQGGAGYYLDSLTWGLGWLLCLAALAGAAIELRRDLVRGLMLASVPVALFVYLCVQARYFGRWLLPAYPALAMLAAVALVAAADALPARGRRAPLVRALALAALVALAVAQPLAADVRTARVLGRQDTRLQARDWLESRYPPELRVAIEPAVPGRYYRSNPAGRLPSWLGRCPPRRGWTSPGFSYTGPGDARVCARFKPGQFARPDGGVRASAYHLVLGPGVVDDLRRYGYCIVMTLNTVRERALETGDPEVRAYYRRLERDSRLLREFSPYDRGADPVPFSFDLSFNYYPAAYRRPGPTVRLYRLDRCRQAYGAPLVRIPKVRELPPFAPRDDEAPAEES